MTRQNILFAAAGALILSLMMRAGAQTPAETSPYGARAAVIQVGMAQVSSQLFQMAYSEYDALKSREQQTRFIPQQIYAYFLEESSGLNIKIVATYRHAEPALSKADAELRCKGMLNWVRFHLGIKDDGTPIAYASEFRSSTMYQFIDTEGADRVDGKWAMSLDEQTILLGVVANIGKGRDGIASCKGSLVQEKEPRR